MIVNKNKLQLLQECQSEYAYSYERSLGPKTWVIDRGYCATLSGKYHTVEWGAL